MTDEERNIITAVWNDMVLRKKLEDAPYGVPSSDLVALKNHDRLNAKLAELDASILLNEAARGTVKVAP